MTTVTIHAEDAFAAALRTYARTLGKSVNQTVKDVFAPILGPDGTCRSCLHALPKGVRL